MKGAKRITLVIHSLEPGGAERVLSIMANWWAKKGREVTIITFTDAGEKSFYELASTVNIVSLSLSKKSSGVVSGLLNNVGRVAKLRRAISKSRPDVVISFIDTTNALVALACRGLGVPLILAEHNEPSMADIGRIWEAIRTITYPMADKVALLSERARGYYPERIRRKTIVIPNPVVMAPESETGTIDASVKVPFVMSMGRLGPEKGYDLLIKAFSIIANRYPEWSLVILGEGAKRGELKNIIEELGLSGRVMMPGLVKNPYDYLKQAGLYVLSSRYEGFPVALCEAMASGTAVVSFDCKTGPREIIREGVDGILVPPGDVEKLSESIAAMIDDKKKREEYGANARQVVERFGLEKVMGVWETVIDEIRLRKDLGAS